MVCAASYSLARLNLAQAEETSGLDTDAGVEVKRTRREPFHGYYSETDSTASTSNEASLISRRQVPAGLNVANQQLSVEGYCISYTDFALLYCYVEVSSWAHAGFFL